MTNRKSSVRDGIEKKVRNLSDRLRMKRRRKERRLLSETLETRQLLAGPELIGVQSNEGDLFRDFETQITNTLPTSVPELDVSPRELVFRFNDDAVISPESLQGITITRAGSDGFFEAANATTDLGTNGSVLVEFRSQTTGAAGNGTQIVFATSDRGPNGLPVITSVNASGAQPVVTLNLNSAAGRPATVADLVSAVNNTASVNQFISVQQVSGASLTKVGLTVDTSRSLTLTGANAAQAISDLDTNGAIRVRLTATQTGSAGTGTEVIVKQRNFGGSALPLVLVSGNTVELQVNSTPGFETTVDEFLLAINSNAEASLLVTGSLEFGSGSTLIGNRTPTYSPLVLSGASDSVIEPGYVGLGDSPREVVFRFAETLPDDTYRIDINAAGALGLRNEDGEYFNDGISVSGQFTVNVGPKVLAVVPQPVTRSANGTLNSAPNVIEVHVDGGDVNVASLEREDLYRLIYTRDTLTSSDDFEMAPTSAVYNSLTKVVRLEFPNALSRVVDPLGNGSTFIDGSARLRIGSSEPIRITPTSIPVNTDPADNFTNALNLNNTWTISSNANAGIQSARLTSEIRNTSSYDLNLPGEGVPGTRDLRPDDPSRLDRTIPLDVFRQGADSEDGIAVFQYNFVNSWLGDDPTKAGIDETREYFNLITEQQKARVREVLSLFSEYLGVQFVETNGGLTDTSSFSIAVGELYGADPRVNSATAIRNADGSVQTTGPEAVVVATRDRNVDGIDDLVVLDFQDFDQSTDDQLGGEFFRGAFLAVGQLLGYGYADHLAQPVTQSTASVLNPGTDNEPAFPSVADIVNGQFLYRPESNDIDVYQFTLNQAGSVSIETIAERLPDASLLNTALRLYKRDSVTGKFTEVAANDDYFSNDSLIELELEKGTYAIGVSASGNTTYDPATPGSGFGGKSEGAYELSLSFRAKAADGITDNSGNALDGDLDGNAGGLFNFWFVPNDPNTTLFVDKAATNPDLIRSTPNPYLNLDDALAAALPGDTIRVIGNGGVDGDVSTLDDNFAYEVGKDNRGISLSDGESIVVPQGVNLVIDAGAVFKMRRSQVSVGSTAPLVDQSESSLQILGTPTLIGSNGRIITDANGVAIPGSVVFTSFNDDLDPTSPDSASKGDWGGIDFRGDIDSADESRVFLEDEGIFLNHIQYADLRYGGGQVSLNGRQTVISPIDMAVTRPTIINSSISVSADAAMAATPDTFAESRFMTSSASGTVFTPDYERVGPHIRGNTLDSNTINGLFVRVATRTGGELQPLTVGARLDDTDIVHVLTENLQISGSAGGLVQTVDAPVSLLIRASSTDAVGEPLEGNMVAGTYRYRMTFTTASGVESDASQPTAAFTLDNDGALQLTGLPTVPGSSNFTSRRLYRATVQADGSDGPYLLVANLNASNTSYVDTALAGSTALSATTGQRTARLDAGLTVDPGTIIKLDGARIDVTFGAHFYAEGTTERPVIMTSLADNRYGAGGTFDTNSTNTTDSLSHGDWAGLYVGFGGAASIDHAVIAGAGGISRIPGGFASFNAIEVHQADLRLANSRFEMNDDGREVVSADDPDRGGRSDNASGTIFVRASQPIITNNTFIGGYGPVGTFDVNSFSFNEVTDPGRSTGPIDMVSSTGNSGPLIQGNRLAQDEDLADTVDRFGLNGIEVRGGAVSTEVVLDDVDIVHIVRDTIEIPNQHIYGGMRLESDARGSLVVKFEGATAGIVAGGNLQTSEDQFQDIADRIGGSLQVVGHPDFPVVLTALVDDTIGAGFRPDGTPSVDTDANGIRQSILTSETTSTATPAGLPVGPEYDRTDREVDNGTLIDNDIDPNVIGFFEATVADGNEVTNITVTGIDQATATRLQQQNYGFLETTVVDIDYLPGSGTPLIDTTFRLSQTTITRPATLISPDTVISEGTFNMLNASAADPRPVNWLATTFFLDNRAVMYTTVEFFTPDNRDFGDGNIEDIQVISYLDADVGNGTSDTLYSVGVPGEQDFRAMTINGQNRVGFSHGGIYVNDGTNQFNATYDGWMADDAARLLTAVDTENTNFTVIGDIDQAFTAQANDPLFPTATAAFGIGDIGTSFAWTLDSNQDRAKVTSFIEWIPSDPANPFEVQLPLNIEGSGDWDGITIREAAADRNVSITSENEPRNVGVSDTNPTPGQSQFLGELAPNQSSGDENRRLGFIVDGSISQASDIDVYSFIGEAGTQIWLDIDRTDLRLDTVIELIDANGNTLVLSDNSMAESLGNQSRLVAPDGRYPAADAGSVNLISANDPNVTTQDHQDLYSTNPRDAGMRLILPGEAGQRNLYHVRIRSSSVESGSNQSLIVSGQTAASVPSSLRRGLTSGSYQLQVRLQEVDEHAGTQVRFSDVRFAVNGIQVIGGPIHSPLAGDEYELDTVNDTLSAAQRLGLYSVAIDDENLVDAAGNPVLDANGNPIAARNNGPLSSDRLSKTIGGVIDSLTDVDWYEFDIQYENLTRDNAAMYFATAFDLDYADGLARTDTAIYVFNSAGELVLIGTDSNIADDQPLGSADAEDLSRGSFGTGDPFIGSAELSEGTYYVAVSNQQRVPQPMDQFFDPNSTNPLLRLEPIDSVQRVVEEHFEFPSTSGTASSPQFPVLFDNDSIIDYTFDDVMLYVNTGTGLFLVNPYTGETYSSATQGSGFLGNFGDEVRDVAFGSNGELFAYTGFSNRQPADDAWAYYSIDTATAALGTPISTGGGMTTHHLSSPPPANPTVLNVDSDDGLEVEAITIREFLNAETGFLVGNRPFPQNGLAYTTNILYGFNENTGVINGGNFNLDVLIPGAGTSRREIGQIDTVAPTGARPLQLGFTAATVVNSAGIATQSLFDGDMFTLTNQVETVTFEFDQGFTLSIDDTPVTNPDGTLGNPRTIPFGDTVVVKLPGQTAQVFEFVSDPADVTGTNTPVVISNNLGPEALIERLAATIRQAGISVSAAGSQMSLPTAETVTLQTDPLTTSTSLVLSGTPGVESGNFRIPLFPTDTAGVIAQRIVNAVDQANTAGDLPNVNAFIDAGATDAHSVRIVGGFIGDPVGSAASLPTGNLTAGGLPTGGTVTGVELVNNNLYAITNTGGLFVVSSGELASSVGNRTVGSYVLSSTDLVGINFTGLRAGPASVEDGELRQILFGVTGAGDIYAFNTRGELQPVFAGGRSMISTGIGGALGLDFSILDYNLWHVTERRDTDAGHGISSNFSDTREATTGGNSLAFNFENTAEFQSKYAHSQEVPNGTRLDGTSIVNTYNMPGGAKGEVQSNTFDLSGYAATDLPTLYFSYFLDADDVATVDGARDTLRVYIVDENGVEHLVASNSDYRGTGENDDEFDDPLTNSIETGSLYDDDIDVEVQQLFDNTGSWRQARVPLQPFAGQANLSMRIEFSTAGTTATGTPSIRAVAGKGLVENSQLVVNGEAFAIDLAPAVSAPSGRQLAALYGPDPNAVAVITVDGQEYVLDDGVRPVGANQIPIDLLASQPVGTTLEDLSSSQIATLIADTVDLKRLVPSGTVLAARYLDPDYREEIQYAGQTFILNDGTRPVATNEVSVDLIDPLSNETLDQLSQLEIAQALSLAAGLPLPAYNVTEDFDFSDPSDTPGVTGERNDLLFQATPLPYSGGNATISGTGRIGTVDALGTPSNLNDVDLVRAEVTAGTTIFVDVDLDTNPALDAAVRFFDAKGNELTGFVDQANDTVQITATESGSIYIGISGIGNSTYDPRIAGTTQTGQIDSYTATVNFLSPISAQTDGNLIEVDGAATITSSSPTLLPVSGQEALTGRPIKISRFDTAPEVAEAISLALAERFSDSDTSFVPTSGAMVRTGALTINDFGPFVNEQLRYGDQYAAGFLAGTADNNHEGVFIDDIIIGFAERGELVTDSRAVAQTETFVEDGTRFFTSTPRPTQPTVTGAYQLEIRDASEYVDSEAESQFRTFDTNDRLTDGYALRAFSGTELIDGSTFTVGTAGAELVFEFDLIDASGVNDGLNSPNSQIAIVVNESATETEVGAAIINALNATSVRQILGIDVTGANGSDIDNRINVYGDVTITDDGTAFESIDLFDLRGDSNRDRSDQGVIIIENSRFVFNADAGIELNRGAESRVQGVDQVDQLPAAIVYPRNLVELNTNDLLPGVVVQSNVLAFNANAGVRITGLGPNGGTQSNPIAFDRILNNT
ncbi:pre-peptidase C-terminal domain-containing protein, partial [Novipirellula maiorica]